MNRVGDSIRRGLEEAVTYARGEAKEDDYRVHVPARAYLLVIDRVPEAVQKALHPA